MNHKTKKIIQNLEEQIAKGYSLKIFKGYIAINKRGIEKMISTIYKSLPTDVQKAKQYLQNSNIQTQNSVTDKNTKIYKYVNELETKLKNTTNIATYTIINIREIEKILDKIYNDIAD